MTYTKKVVDEINEMKKNYIEKMKKLHEDAISGNGDKSNLPEILTADKYAYSEDIQDPYGYISKEEDGYTFEEIEKKIEVFKKKVDEIKQTELFVSGRLTLSIISDSDYDTDDVTIDNVRMLYIYRIVTEKFNSNAVDKGFLPEAKKIIIEKIKESLTDEQKENYKYMCIALSCADVKAVMDLKLSLNTLGHIKLNICEK